MRRLVAVFVALALVPAAAASHPSQLRSQRTNLDRDRALETLIGVEDVSHDHSVWRASVRIVDRCRGRNRTYLVLDGYRHLESVSPVQADHRGWNEAIAVLTDVPDTGAARLVRLVRRRGPCAALRTLFRYVSAETHPPPVPELRLTRFRIEMNDLEPAYAGRELVLFEEFQAPPMLSGVMRVTQHRYDRRSDRYVVYATNTHRVP